MLVFKLIMKIKKLVLFHAVLIFGFAYNTYAKSLTKNERNFVDESEIQLALSEGEIANRDFEDLIKPKKLLNNLRNGGYVIYFRHAQTFKDYADQADPNLDLTDCSTQRKLSFKGIQDARDIGQVFTNKKIPIGKIITSQYCRSWKTANYAFGRVDQKDSRLNFLPYEDYTSDHVDLMIKNVTPILSKRPKEGKNTIIVGHDDIFESATGIYPDPQGIAYIIKPLEKGKFQLISNILPQEWAKL